MPGRFCGVISLSVLLTFAVFLAACGGGSNSGSPALNPAAPPPPASAGGSGSSGSGSGGSGSSGGSGGSGGGGSSTNGVLTVSLPANGASVTSPTEFKVTTQAPDSIDHMRVFVDGQSVFHTFHGQFDLPIFIPTGSHNIIVEAWDKSGNTSQVPLQLNVTSQPLPYTFSAIQNMPGWEWCTAELRGTACASGLGNATSAMTPGQSSPSQSGSSARFDIGGPTGYSNALWWRSLSGSSTALSHFQYDVSFFVDKPEVSQALEFDANTAFGGKRFTWGSECNFKDTGKWDIWNPETLKWVATSLPCPPVSGNIWHHLTWNLERDANRVHYISLVRDGTTMPVDIWYNAQPNWDMEDIDIAFQLDGDYKQDPYSVWLDNVNLKVW